MNDSKKNNFARALAINIAVAVILAVCLCVTSAALVISMITVDQNVFATARLDITLYNAEGVEEGAIITENDGYLFAPGVTASKEFSLKNQGTADAYFKLYFDFNDGNYTLADYMKVRFTDVDGNVVYDWTKMSDMVKKKMSAADVAIKAGEELELLIWFQMPETVDDDAKNLKLTFDLCADAVQAKNNDDKTFPEESQGVEDMDVQP